MSTFRGGIAILCVSIALVLQVSVFSYFSWQGVVPNLVLLIVVAAAIARGAQFGMVLGFAAGVLIDLAPPADHIAGRWALALLVVGYIAGRVTQEAKPSATAVVATVAASSFLGTSIFALSGLLLRDPAVAIPDLLQVIGISVAWDVLLTPLVLPAVLALFNSLDPERATA